MTNCHLWDSWVAVQITTLALILAAVAGCTAQREVTPEPVQLTRVLPIAVKNEAWPGIVKTLLLQGEVIQSASRPLGRVTFRRPLTTDNFPKLCDLKTNPSIDVDSWNFFSGIIDITIWLEVNNQTDKTELMMEGRCITTFISPMWKGMALSFTPLPLLLLGPRWVEMNYRSVLFASIGELERELQAKIFTQLGIGLPPWLREPQ